MQKIIEIDITDKNDLFEKYNKKKVSKELINYMIESMPKFKNKDTFKFIINTKIEEKCLTFIIEGLKEEYKKSMKMHYYNDIIQMIYLLFGIIILFISNIIDKIILKEIILISGWVLIWSMVELEIFSDTNGRKKRRILKKILNSEIIEVKNL